MRIPLHFYIAHNAVEKGVLLDAARTAGEHGVSHIWLEVRSQKDTALIREVSSLNLHVVSAIKDPALIEGSLRNGTSGIAVHPGIRKEVLRYRDTLIRSGSAVYLYMREEDRSVLEGEGFFSLVNEIVVSYGELKREKIENLFVHIHHPDPVLHFNISRYLKKRYGIRHVVSLTPCRSMEDSLIPGSLTLGSLFYERIGERVLLRLSSDQEYSRKNVSEAALLARNILGSCRLYPRAYTIISCPTCGRCRMDLQKMTEEIDHRLKALEKKYNQDGKNLEDVGGIAVAVMGCNVNGPGEARSADIGIAGSKNNTGILFKNGRVFKTFPENRLADELMIHTKDIIDKKFNTANIP